MFANILFFSFLSTFTAIAVLGHVLLLAAIWPNLFGSESGGKATREPASGAASNVYSVEH